MIDSSRLTQSATPPGSGPAEPQTSLLPLLLALPLLVLAALAIGPAGLDADIAWRLRLPRIVGALAAGAALALSGVGMQAVLRNPLADPWILGMAGGASLGAVLAVVGDVPLPPALAGALGALAAAVVVSALARDAAGASPERLLLAGVAVSVVLGALTTLLLQVAPQAHAARAALYWTSGGLGAAGLAGGLALGAATLVATAIARAGAPDLDRLLLGDDAAATLGVAVRPARWALLAGAAALTGGVVALAGPLGFVGLVAPHLARRLGARTHAVLIPVATVLGAALLLAADTSGRALGGSREIAAGTVTALIGGPWFLWLLRRGDPLGSESASVRDPGEDARVGPFRARREAPWSAAAPAGAAAGPAAPERAAALQAPRAPSGFEVPLVLTPPDVPDQPTNRDPYRRNEVPLVLTPPPALTAHALTLRRGARALLDGVGVDVPVGATVAIVGPNGAGKSTLLRVLAGILSPDAGTVALHGAPLPPPRERARRVAFLFQDHPIPPGLTARDVVALGGRHVDEALDRVGATALAGAPMTLLSGGERQRVHLARCLAARPDVLLLDEPTNHLDLEGRARLLAILPTLSVVLATHDLDLAGAAHLAVLLDRGRVVSAGPAASVLTPAALSTLFGVPLRRVVDPAGGPPLTRVLAHVPHGAS